jgi:hypothetical protein
MFDKAYAWLLHSGIQEPGGGVARYYRADLAKNAPVSTEITGYVVAGLIHLHPRSKGDGSLGSALAAARFLTDRAWSESDHTFPFEPGSPYAYFFDTGITVRGLLSAWFVTRENQFAERAKDAALSLAFDFLGDGCFHPVITLPGKQPLPYEPGRWSRSPGCYHLKAALAWKEVSEAFGDPRAARAFETALAMALATHEGFLPGVNDPEKVMDRLHAYCYFLEALLFVADRAACRAALETGIARVSSLLREIAPRFERSDVCAQLLRVRLIAHRMYGLPLDRYAAEEEAARAAQYQAKSEDPRIDGGFWFGRRNGELAPYVNPVSTLFCRQALALWDDDCENRWRFELHELI